MEKTHRKDKPALIGGCVQGLERFAPQSLNAMVALEACVVQAVKV